MYYSSYINYTPEHKYPLRLTIELKLPLYFTKSAISFEMLSVIDRAY